MTQFEWIAAFVFAVVSTARITRVATYDDWPPALWVRGKWDRLVKKEGYHNADIPQATGPWWFLLHCGYCFGVWAAALVAGTAYWSLETLGEIHWAWWLITGWLTVAYLAAIVMANDGEDE